MRETRSDRERKHGTGRGLKIALASAALIALAFTGWLLWGGGTAEKPTVSGDIVPRVDNAVPILPAPRAGESAKQRIEQLPVPKAPPAPPVTEDRVVRYEGLKKHLTFKIQDSKDQEEAARQEARKEPYGLRESVDMIVRTGESISVGGAAVPMQEILDAVRIREGELIEKSLIEEGSPSAEPEASSGVKRFPIKIDRSRSAEDDSGEYGIYVVQPGDNIWNIHFKLLKEHFAAKGIRLPPFADKPGPRGFSSGIGRILKFSEKEVYIYNVLERRLSTDIGMIFPLSKIVVYNMKRVTSLLAQIDPQQLDHLRFDGTTLWVEGEKKR